MGSRFWNFGGQFVAKMESRIDAANGAEKSKKTKIPTVSEFPGLEARRELRGEEVRKKGRKEERKKESKKDRR